MIYELQPAADVFSTSITPEFRIRVNPALVRIANVLLQLGFRGKEPTAAGVMCMTKMLRFVNDIPGCGLRCHEVGVVVPHL